TTRQASRISSPWVDIWRAWRSCGSAFGATRTSSRAPKLRMTRAVAPTLADSSGRTSTTRQRSTAFLRGEGSPCLRTRAGERGPARGKDLDCASRKPGRFSTFLRVGGDTTAEESERETLSLPDVGRPRRGAGAGRGQRGPTGALPPPVARPGPDARHAGALLRQRCLLPGPRRL